MLSIILYGRNDSHGYNLHKRAAISFNCLAHLLTDPDDEIIFVDCNTPNDLPTFPEAIQDTLTPRARQLLRILRFRPALFEQVRRGSHLYVLEPQSRNLAIRRANPANRWILSTNTDMIFVPRRAGRSLSDIVADLPDGFYELPRFELPETLWESLDRSDPQAIIAACARWGQSLHLNEVITNVADIRYDGPGDFQLMLREQIYAIHGFNEEMVLGWHVDSNLCRRMYLYNGRIDSLVDHLFGYHCDHTRQATLAHGANRIANDLERFYFRVVSPFLPEQAETWGMPDASIEEIRLTPTHLWRLERALEQLLPPQTAPYTERAYTRDGYNEPLFYDHAHVLPFVADHLVNLPPSADVGYLGSNSQLLALIGRFRSAIGHEGRILYDPKLLQHASVGCDLPPSCVGAPESEIFERSASFIFDASLSAVGAAASAAAPGVASSSAAAENAIVAFSQELYKSLLVFAQAERDRILASQALPRKFLLIAGQHTWFEQATAPLIATTATPFSSCVRHGYVRLDAQFPVGVELERGARGIQRLVRDPTLPTPSPLPPPRSMCRRQRIHPDQESARVLWQAPLFSPSPLADESCYLIWHLTERGVPIAARKIGLGAPEFRNHLPEALREALQRAEDRSLGRDFIAIVDAPASLLQREPGAAYAIGRVTCEAETMPAAWSARCNEMDEIWVPSAFQAQALRSAGVQAPILTFANGVDVDRFRPGLPPAYFRGLRRTVFLFVGDWAYHQGWDVLLRAWARAFRPDEDVSLLIHAHLLGTSAVDDEATEIGNRIERFLHEELRCSREDVAPIVIARDPLPYACLPNLLAAAHVLVAPARGGGWGHWRMAAMASGLAVIGTRWGAPLDYMNDDNSLLIDVERLVLVDERAELSFLRGLRWAEPSVEHLTDLLRRAVDCPQEMAALGRRARQDMVDRWQWSSVAAGVADRLLALEAERARRPMPSARSAAVDLPPISWEGELFTHTSFGLINRELGLRLLDAGCQITFQRAGADHFEPQVDPRFARLAERACVRSDQPFGIHVRHRWPPDLTPPPEGHWVMIQPWEYGSLPKDWIPVINEQVDEVWVPTGFVKDCYKRSGVDPDRVYVIPWGVDTTKFHPQAIPASLPTQKRFKFLFMGATIWRKGPDLLLDAYLSQFTADDDVCLVIKDLPGYPGRFVADRIRQAQADPNAPEILYLAEAFAPDDLPGLYAACDCFVLPYRGEGFGLPIVEAMACGRPVIVTNYGAALDVCNAENAYLIPASVIWMPERRVAHLETVDSPYLAEPSVEHLGRLLRQVYERPQEALTIGRRAADHVRKNFTWEKAAEKALERLQALVHRPIRRQQRAYYEFTAKSLALLSQGKAAEAETLLRAGVARYPQDADLLCNLAELVRVRGDLGEADSLFQRALALEAENAGALLGAAALALDRGDVAEAIRMYGRARTVYPELAETLDPVIVQLGGVVPADAPTVVAGPDAACPTDVGQQVVDSQRALDDLLAAGRAALDRGDLPAAVQAFTEVTTRDPDLAAGHSALAMALLALDRPAEAIAPLRRALALAPTATAFNQLGVALYQTGDLDGAAAAFADAQRTDPADVAAYLNLIDLHRARGQYAPATETVKEALRRWPDHADVLAAFGVLCVELGDAEGAQIALQRLQAVAPDHAAVAALRQALA
jgi:glycosyltransferase involved in cell wall biosynthesis/Flp pilus assembly protein TadD